jgi:hypothetical protein
MVGVRLLDLIHLTMYNVVYLVVNLFIHFGDGIDRRLLPMYVEVFRSVTVFSVCLVSLGVKRNEFLELKTSVGVVFFCFHKENLLLFISVVSLTLVTK